MKTTTDGPSLYRLSQDAIEAAEHAEAIGDEDQARRHYCRAADFQERWVDGMDWASKPRTKSTFTRSAACLYLRAGAVDDALRLALILTTTDGVTPVEAAKGHEIIAAVERAKVAP